MDANESTTNDADTATEADAREGAAQEEGQQDQDVFDRQYVEKLRRENAKYRTRVKELEPQAAKLRELEDASKSELERAQERIKALESEHQAAQSKLLRADVAQTKGVPAHLLPTSGTKEELEEAADKLLAWAGENKKSSSLPRVGAVGADSSGLSRDELARSVLGVDSQQ